MLSSFKYRVAALAALGMLSVAPTPVHAITVTIDGVSSNRLNGAGNRNVLRPALTNPAYLTASSTGGRLTGGAGPDAASIGDWMMMED